MLFGGLHFVFLYIVICGMQARRKDYNHTILLRIFNSIMFLVKKDSVRLHFAFSDLYTFFAPTKTTVVTMTDIESF